MSSWSMSALFAAWVPLAESWSASWDARPPGSLVRRESKQMQQPPQPSHITILAENVQVYLSSRSDQADSIWKEALGNASSKVMFYSSTIIVSLCVCICILFFLLCNQDPPTAHDKEDDAVPTATATSSAVPEATRTPGKAPSVDEPEPFEATLRNQEGDEEEEEEEEEGDRLHREDTEGDRLDRQARQALKKGSDSEAETLFRALLARDRQTLGNQDRATLATMASLVGLVEKRTLESLESSDIEETNRLYGELIATSRQVLVTEDGTDHQDTLDQIIAHKFFKKSLAHDLAANATRVGGGAL